MNVKEEDVFLILLAARLRRAETDGYHSSYAVMTQAVLDSTTEVMSVVGKMSKSEIGRGTIT